MKFQNYIKSIRSSGHYAFTTEKALADLRISKNALNCGTYKLKKKGDIVSPAKNLYVIVPPEYQPMGCLPAEELIPILMKHWDLPYYVCILSAAQQHGASHQKPQIFQVMTNKQIKPIICGKVRIEFIYKKSLDEKLVQKKVVKTGYLNISPPELTAMDLFIYAHQAGGINNIATILSELIESINIEKLMELIEKSTERAWVQRLGYVLEHIDSMTPDHQSKIINAIDHYLKKQQLNPVALAPELPIRGATRNSRWLIIENTTIESDL